MMSKKALNKMMMMKSKMVDGGMFTQRYTALDLVANEIQVLLHLTQHRNIVSLLEVIDNPKNDRLFMILEFAPFGQIMKWDGATLRYLPNAYLVNKSFAQSSSSSSSSSSPLSQQIVIPGKPSFHCPNDPGTNPIYRFHEHFAKRYFQGLVDALAHC
ncbi:hypothetical protein RFI_17871 [Reticulomyxa filosa]|uniref:Protein kinase domain-containing protein n=1 Tax=Reticulomyxa filosa TaxID=46433 RepID=X6N0V5_RETFI|nr:hypothetical protein RFI_17871 [Reticulomyxa filosa]|eukprot:ETO19359.1 hypothetical protein RFI_17871 [Reticulomyxa filosa]